MPSHTRRGRRRPAGTAATPATCCERPGGLDLSLAGWAAAHRPPGLAEAQTSGRCAIVELALRTGSLGSSAGASVAGGLQRLPGTPASRSRRRCRELVAAAAARLVLLERADDDRRAVGRSGRAVDEPLRHRRRAAAAVADGLQLVDDLRAAEQLRHRPEREAAKVLVEAGRDDAKAALDETVEDEHDLGREELHLVDADDVVAVDETGDVGGTSTATARIFAPA